MQRLVLIVGWLAGCSLVAGCGGSGEAPTNDQYPEHVLEAGSRLWPQGTYVFRSEPEWRDAWTAAPPFAIGDQRSAPPIEFSANMVVGVVVGWGTSGCAGAAIVRSTEEPSRVRVEYSYSDGTPPAGIACTANVPQLVAFAVVPYSDKPVEFVAVGG